LKRKYAIDASIHDCFNFRVSLKTNQKLLIYYKIVLFFRILFAHRSFSVRGTGYDEPQFWRRIRLPNGRLWTNACVSLFLDIHIDTQTVTGGYNMSEFRQICRRGICRRMRFYRFCSEDRRGAVYLWVQAKCNLSSLFTNEFVSTMIYLNFLDTRFSSTFTQFSRADF